MRIKCPNNPNISNSKKDKLPKLRRKTYKKPDAGQRRKAQKIKLKHEKKYGSGVTDQNQTRITTKLKSGNNKKEEIQ